MERCPRRTLAVAKSNTTCLIISADDFYKVFTKEEIQNLYDNRYVTIPTPNQLKNTLLNEKRQENMKEKALLDALKLNNESSNYRDSLLDCHSKKLSKWLSNFNSLKFTKTQQEKRRIINSNKETIQVDSTLLALQKLSSN